MEDGIASVFSICWHVFKYLHLQINSELLVLHLQVRAVAVAEAVSCTATCSPLSWAPKMMVKKRLTDTSHDEWSNFMNADRTIDMKVE